ncbi:MULTISPECIES: hypothetical protein [unclassified Okeania]|uniref:hypothetical protein n=1 Tax=unclassified Okeania TaxID=2634635 RepID=UPI0013BA3EA7|nr:MULTISPECIES: hypothetical protein [unclassified Okeania]NES78280.1 hypothetical protein [Okeania sp. SIO1H4]NET15537.1 hypothetical protein [Okeania sp. SIO1H6]NET21620.1 hypothetical protein [Okeania sp. SIO1H5]NET94969.1 hypothetical protein [Okeania sp. SIO1H2]
MAIVEKGDWIKFNPKAKEDQTIKWQQNLGSRQEEYIVVPYSVKDKQASGSLFIELGLADSFFEKCQEDESKNPLVSGGYKIQVDDAFQYGQNNEKTLRFLVYHNKSNKPYQHRFIETTAFSNIGKKIVASANAAGAAAATATGAGAATAAWEDLLKQGEDIAKAFIGDYLRNF